MAQGQDQCAPGSFQSSKWAILHSLQPCAVSVCAFLLCPALIHPQGCWEYQPILQISGTEAAPEKVAQVGKARPQLSPSSAHCLLLLFGDKPWDRFPSQRVLSCY